MLQLSMITALQWNNGSRKVIKEVFELVQSRQAGVFHKPHLGALTFDEILSKLP